MKLIFRVVFFGLVFVFVATSSSEAFGLSGPRFMDPALPIQVEVGQEFALVLDANPTTGYQWQLLEPPNSEVLKLVRTEYQGPSTTLVGAGGRDVWVFQTVNPGRTVISLGYLRPWEAGVAPARVVNYVVTVRAKEEEAGEARTPEEAAQIIGAKAQLVVGALQNKEFIKFSGFFHPDRGVRFSPSAQVNVEKDVVLQAGDVAPFLASRKKLDWGNYAGSGLPIKLTLAEYYRRFIYDAPFATSSQIGYNQIIGRSNAANNVSAVYPGALVVEFYLPGSNPKYQGMDWKSLRLVFAQKDFDWYLIGLVHDEWTI